MDTTAHRLLIRLRSDLVDGFLPARAVDARGLDASQVHAVQQIADALWRLMNDDPAPPECQTCATGLVQPTTGRPRRYCSDACRSADARSRSVRRSEADPDLIAAQRAAKNRLSATWPPLHD